MVDKAAQRAPFTATLDKRLRPRAHRNAMLTLLELLLGVPSRPVHNPYAMSDDDRRLLQRAADAAEARLAAKGLLETELEAQRQIAERVRAA